MKKILLIATLLFLIVVVATSQQDISVGTLSWGAILNERIGDGQATIELISAEDSLFVAVVRRYSEATGEELGPDSFTFTGLELLDTRSQLLDILVETNALLKLMQGML